jgi:hypothetical protein
MCNCKNVAIGSYDNQVVTNLPHHMIAYKAAGRFSNVDSICLDVCIAEEVQDLWLLGITTTGCCCGHNKMPSYIGVIPNDISRMKDLGYEVAFNPSRPDDEDSFTPTSIKQ